MSDSHPTNRLIDETSPYLLQHARNPVDWYPWGEEAFAKATAEDKPIFLSVGYSACHWCHVMEHESFEDEAIANILNEHYVSIKVDREERPDVDQIYMSAVQLITRRGGWPMSVFMTAEGAPFYGGTYWPPTSRMGMPGFRDILLKLADYWKTRRDEVNTSAAQLVAAIQDMAAPVFESADLNEETLHQASKELLSSADRKHGGFGSAPKFPHPMDLRLLLRSWLRFGETETLDVAKLTLDKMLYGGIYDQLGGGFHRYSTDAYWLAPHFEKMLYDNALLAPAYLEAWKITKNNEYKRAVVESLDYILREMTAPEGGFYSTQDADSEGEEGKFFVWSKKEIDNLLPEQDAAIFDAAYDVSPNGNWEGKSILNRPKSLLEIANALEVDLSDVLTSLERSRQTLFAIRGQRIAPGRDDKLLVSWNGMMISAMAQAGFALNDERYLQAAEHAANFIQANLLDDQNRILHSFKDGQARFQGYLDDYASLIDGLLDLYQFRGNIEHLNEAIRLADQMIDQFWDEESGGFFYTAHDHESLIARCKEIQDQAVPSANGTAATALTKLARLTGENRYLDRARRTLDAFAGMIADHPRACGQALIATDLLLNPGQEIVVAYSNDQALREELLTPLRQTFLPHSVLVHHNEETNSQTQTQSNPVAALVSEKSPGSSGMRLYLCENGACQTPAETVEQVRNQLNISEN